MYSKIEWQTGEPKEFGFYLILKQDKKTGEQTVGLNQYATNNICKHPIKVQGWQILLPDRLEIIAWYKVDNIKVVME